MKSAATSTPPDWARLEELVKRLSGRGRPRNADEIREFWQLYRAATSRLAAIQAQKRPSEELWYLNRLVAAAHAVLYRVRRRRSASRRFLAFLGSGWPALVREHRRWVGAATAIFLAGAAIGIWYSATDAAFPAHVTPPEILASIERGEMWTDDIRDMKPVASSFIFSNNLMVAILAFAAGITAGLGTVWILFANGVSFGAISWVVATHGMSRGFWGFVVAHGALELPAIFLAGAAGLVLGRGILFPRELPRSRSIALAGRTAFRLFAGTAPLFVVAAVVEGFFSPQPYPLSAKLGMSALLGAVLLLWVLSARRGEGGSVGDGALAD
ncbi:MAG: membrane protein [Gemmatimonadota bacterium]|nr:MAG: membrane protein [Gemmatimonadota bacterium]